MKMILRLGTSISQKTPVLRLGDDFLEWCTRGYSVKDICHTGAALQGPPYTWAVLTAVHCEQRL